LGSSPPRGDYSARPRPDRAASWLYRFHLQLQAADGEKLRAAVRNVMTAAPKHATIQWTADIDPLDMM